MEQVVDGDGGRGWTEHILHETMREHEMQNRWTE